MGSTPHVDCLNRRSPWHTVVHCLRFHMSTVTETPRPWEVARPRAIPVLCVCLGLLAITNLRGGATPPADADLHFDESGEPLTATSNAPQQQATDFIELEAEIEIEPWPVGSARKYEVRCLVGKNEWLVAGTFRGRDPVTYWFTGTNIIEQVVGAAPGRQEVRQGREGVVHIWQESPRGLRLVTTRTESVDGNPGRPRYQTDLMPAPAALAWLAFCSGRLLSQEPCTLLPVGDLWKQVMPVSSFRNHAEFFENKFNLPKRVDLFTPEGQLVFQYHGLLTTNLLGWEFPREFRFAQYRPMRLPEQRTFSTNHWEIDFLARGVVKSLGPAKRSPGELAGASSHPVPEPVYEGRPISAWTDELLTVSHIAKTTEQNRAAVRAIRAMGTNALPWLLAEMRQVPSLGEDQGPAGEPPGGHLHQARARFGFWALGEAGSPAIPELLKLLDQKPDAVPSALAGIGAPAIPALEYCLTNAPHYVPPYLLRTVPGSRYVVSALGGLAMALQAGRIQRIDAEHLVPVVRAWADDTNKTGAYWARGVLSQLGVAE